VLDTAADARRSERGMYTMPCYMVHQPNVHVPVQVYLPGSSNGSIPDIELSQYTISTQEGKFWKRVKAAMAEHITKEVFPSGLHEFKY
jgi:hypothetical protein